MVKLDLLSIDALKSTLTAFNPSIEQQKPRNALQAYLDFYSLPIPHEQISLCAGNINVNQKSVFVCAWQPPSPRGTALVVHGYLDHLGLYRHLINHLIDKNLAVVCFDLPGHGLSDGQAAFIEDFAEYTAVLEALIDLCQRYYPAPFHGLGQSTGGAILLKHLLAKQHNKDYSLASLNLFAPLLHPATWWLNRRLLPLIKPFRKSFVRHFGRSSQDQAFLDFLCHKDLLQATSIPVPWLLAADKWAREFEGCEGNDFPVNIIQGDADKTLNWKYNMRTFKQKLPNMNLHMIKSANHHMVNECQSLRTEIFNCIKL